MFYLTKKVKHDFLETCAQIRKGSLRLKTPEGEIYDFGTGAPAAEMEIHDWAVVTSLAARGDVGMGETYVDGLWDTPSIADLASVSLLNLDQFHNYAYAGFWATLKFKLVNQLFRANTPRGSSRNIRAHYDVGNEFYQLWLDPSMTYSSALFAQGDNDLERAQNRKYNRILDRLPDGERILEIGCGWGGFAERAARAGRHVTGLTISPSQKGYADARLDGDADIRLQDYRHVEGKFDNIVSIEMIEAVGESYWPTYFKTLKDRLSDSGKAVIQAITVPDSYFDIYRRNTDYVREYTFPGGMLLSDAIISGQARQAGLKVVKTFEFGKDYGTTCHMWARELTEKAAKIHNLGYDRKFMRNWQFYLNTCAASFDTRQTGVVQVELAHA